jgi:hypothetical protein
MLNELRSANLLCFFEVVCLRFVSSVSMQYISRGLPLFSVLLAALASLLLVHGTVSPDLIGSWAAVGGSVWLFQQLLRQLTPGAPLRSRLLYAGLLLALSPGFVQAGVSAGPDARQVFFLLAMLWCGLRAFDRPGPIAVLGALGCAVLLMLNSQYLLPPSEWSPGHFFQTHFATRQGVLRYPVPNGLYVFSIIGHPALFLGIAVLFLVFRKTDLHLSSRKIVLAGLIGYLGFVAGLPHQAARLLLPAYILLLLLLFPAWDRFICYGFYFLRERWMHPILGIFTGLQIFFSVKIIVGPALSLP